MDFIHKIYIRKEDISLELKASIKDTSAKEYILNLGRIKLKKGDF